MGNVSTMIINKTASYIGNDSIQSSSIGNVAYSANNHSKILSSFLFENTTDYEIRHKISHKPKFDKVLGKQKNFSGNSLEQQGFSDYISKFMEIFIKRNKTNGWVNTVSDRTLKLDRIAEEFKPEVDEHIAQNKSWESLPENLLRRIVVSLRDKVDNIDRETFKYILTRLGIENVKCVEKPYDHHNNSRQIGVKNKRDCNFINNLLANKMEYFLRKIKAEELLSLNNNSTNNTYDENVTSINMTNFKEE